MTRERDLGRLADTLNRIAAFYQFRSLDERLYGRLTVSQSYCLRLIYFEGARTMSELAGGLHVRLSTITGVVDQLESKGLVAREAHPKDRRSLRVALTSAGRKLYGAAHQAFLSHLEPLFEGWTAGEREKILSFLADAAEAIQGWQKSPRRKAKRR
jgi:MarR family 2-MHQ and catechol resistance regulon transcriptional repressor